ncbi:prenyltransferase/squalene oxidase repeat-containing protein [Rubrobacter tropicus]|nr:prenyltransferase/squalene oxidase repeat-containing protein [Rubrobacter tropicus]
MTEQYRRELGLSPNDNGDRGVVPEDERRAVARLIERGLSRPLQATDYDTSWALRLSNANGTPAYPRLLGPLLDRQREDGSWGGQIHHGHDRLLTTLAVVIAISGLADPRAEESRDAGVLYLRRHSEDLDPETDRTIGFELIFPALLEEAAEIGLDLPLAAPRHLEREREAKLNLLPKDGILTSHTTALFSLEAFRPNLDVEEAAGLLLDNGSMANSPSATACLLGQIPDWRDRLPRSAAYLDALLAPPASGLPAAHPCDVFVRAWTLYYMQHGGLFEANRDLLEPYLEHLWGSVWPKGVGFASTSGFVDSDDTAMTMLVLHRAGYEVDGSLLLAFEEDRWFSVHKHESNPSVSANLHILEASPVIPEKDRGRVREKILAHLFAIRRGGAYWRDKWHASVYYPTTRALAILSRYERSRLEPTVEWLLANQRSDGSWGEHMPTTEETSLVLLSLLQYHRTARPVPKEPMRRAAAYLLAADGPTDRGFPELWIGKSLYAPIFVIEAVRLSALTLYKDTFGEA